MHVRPLREERALLLRGCLEHGSRCFTRYSASGASSQPPPGGSTQPGPSPSPRIAPPERSRGQRAGLRAGAARAGPRQVTARPGRCVPPGCGEAGIAGGSGRCRPHTGRKRRAPGRGGAPAGPGSGAGSGERTKAHPVQLYPPS